MRNNQAVAATTLTSMVANGAGLFHVIRRAATIAAPANSVRTEFNFLKNDSSSVTPKKWPVFAHSRHPVSLPVQSGGPPPWQG